MAETAVWSISFGHKNTAIHQSELRYWERQFAAGGEGGIRTREPLRTTRFPVVLVMTTSILLHLPDPCARPKNCRAQNQYLTIIRSWRICVNTILLGVCLFIKRAARHWAALPAGRDAAAAPRPGAFLKRGGAGAKREKTRF